MNADYASEFDKCTFDDDKHVKIWFISQYISIHLFERIVFKKNYMFDPLKLDFLF